MIHFSIPFWIVPTAVLVISVIWAFLDRLAAGNHYPGLVFAHRFIPGLWLSILLWIGYALFLWQGWVGVGALIGLVAIVWILGFFYD